MRAKAFDQTRQVARRLRITQDSLAEAVITFNSAGLVESANQSALSMFGYASRELEGRFVESFLRVGELPDDEQLATLLATSGPREITGIRCGGRAFPAETRLTHFEPDGLPFHSISLIDITERHKATRQLQIQQGRLAPFRATVTTQAYDRASCTPRT